MQVLIYIVAAVVIICILRNLILGLVTLMCIKIFASANYKAMFAIERKMFFIENAANAGKWDEAVIYVEEQEKLLKCYQKLNGASDVELDSFLRSRGILRSFRDSNYMDWLGSELSCHRLGMPPLHLDPPPYCPDVGQPQTIRPTKGPN